MNMDRYLFDVSFIDMLLVSVGSMGGGVGGRSRKIIGGGGGGEGARSLTTSNEGVGGCGGRRSSMMSG